MRKVARLLKEKILTFGRLLFYSQHDVIFVKYAMEFPYWLKVWCLLRFTGICLCWFSFTNLSFWIG